MEKRVLVLEFRQESNTFNPIVSRGEDFNALWEGEEAFQSSIGYQSAVRGAVEVFREAGVQPVPVTFLRASSGGRVADSVLAHVMERVTACAQSQPFDAVYASLHGATCTESDDDACGALLAHLRSLAGEKPIAASFDLHANITKKILQNTDVICGYQTYPHKDMYESGQRAAKLCLRMLEGKILSLASAAVPMLIPPAGYTTGEGAFRELMEQGKALVKSGQLLDFTIFPVQPWLDIPEIASRIIALGDDPEKVKDCADRLAQMLCDLRIQTQPELLSVDAILDIAERNTSGKPVILAEFADSPNGGCPGDSPVVPLRLLERGSRLRAGVFIRDPAAVEQAFVLGVGGKGTFTIGAAFTPEMPGPLVAEGTVCSLHDGVFQLEGPANRGAYGFLGRSAVVRIGSVDILLCQKGAHSGDPQLYRHFGIEPTLYDLMVVKANTSFRLPYGKITDIIFCADTPGAGAANLHQLPWERIPQGLYPFAEDIAPQKAEVWDR